MVAVKLPYCTRQCMKAGHSSVHVCTPRMRFTRPAQARVRYLMVWQTQTPTPTHTRYKSAIADDGSNRAVHVWSGPSDAGSTTSRLVGHGFHHGGGGGSLATAQTWTTSRPLLPRCAASPNVDCSPHSASHRQSRWATCEAFCVLLGPHRVNVLTRHDRPRRRLRRRPFIVSSPDGTWRPSITSEKEKEKKAKLDRT